MNDTVQGWGINRRKFLGLAAAGLAVSRAGLADAAQNKELPAKFKGVQLYTLRSLMQKDVAETLELVAATGYRQVEFAGYFDKKPRELRRILDGEGLTAPASHVPLDSLEKNFNGVLDAALALGNRYLVLPWLDGDRRNLASYRELAERFNRWGEDCRKAGVRFAYHNHAFEFEDAEGQVPYHLLLRETDPALVFYEMDLFWIRKAGRDPLEYFGKHPGRFPLWHIKDMDSAGEMVDVGSGVIDFPRIVDKADVAGLEYGFVEHDQPADPTESIRASYSTVNDWNRG